MDINQEIDNMAETMVKSVKPTQKAIDLVKSTVLELGPEGLRKAFPTLSNEQKTLLKSVLEDMRKAHKTPGPNAKQSTEPQSLYSEQQGDYIFNEDKRPAWTKEDEDINEEAEKKNQDKIRNQGGTPVEGWEGQEIGETPKVSSEPSTPSDVKVPAILKSEDLEKKQGVPKGADPAVHEKCVNDVKAQGQDKSSAYAICNASGAGMKKAEDCAYSDENSGEEPLMKDKKAKAKEKVTGMIKRMQERKMEKSQCIQALADKLDVSADKVEKVWDVIAKSMEKDSEEGTKEEDQVESPDHMEESKKTKAKESMSGKPEKVAKSYFYEEEIMYEAKAEDVFKSNRFGKNTHYDVDAFIAQDAIDRAKRLSKSSFDEETSKTLNKSESNKADLNDLIEKNLDMSESSVIVAKANQAAKPAGGFFVKSFNDDDMDALFVEQDMFKSEKKSEATLEKAGKEGSRGGKVIGHTKSGKPIYEEGNKGAKGWSAEDHMDAYHAHTEHGMDYGEKKRSNPEFQANRWNAKVQPNGPGSAMMRTPEEASAVSSQHVRDLEAKENQHHAIADKHYWAAKKKKD